MAITEAQATALDFIVSGLERSGRYAVITTGLNSRSGDSLIEIPYVFVRELQATQPRKISILLHEQADPRNWGEHLAYTMMIEAQNMGEGIVTAPVFLKNPSAFLARNGMTAISSFGLEQAVLDRHEEIVCYGMNELAESGLTVCRDSGLTPPPAHKDETILTKTDLESPFVIDIQSQPGYTDSARITSHQAN